MRPSRLLALLSLVGLTGCLLKEPPVVLEVPTYRVCPPEVLPSECPAWPATCPIGWEADGLPVWDLDHPRLSDAYTCIQQAQWARDRCANSIETGKLQYEECRSAVEDLN